MPGYENPAFQRQEEEDGSSGWILLIHRPCHGHFSLKTLQAMDTMPYLVKYLWPSCLPGVNATANNKFIQLRTTKSQCGFIWYTTQPRNYMVLMFLSLLPSCKGQWCSMGAHFGKHSQRSELLWQNPDTPPRLHLPSLTSYAQHTTFHIILSTLQFFIGPQTIILHSRVKHSHIINKCQESVLNCETNTETNFNCSFKQHKIGRSKAMEFLLRSSLGTFNEPLHIFPKAIWDSCKGSSKIHMEA